MPHKPKLMFVSITFKTKTKLWKVWFSCWIKFPNRFKNWGNDGKNIWEFPSNLKNFRSDPSPLQNVGTDMHFCLKCPLLQLFQHWMWGEGDFSQFIFSKVVAIHYRNIQTLAIGMKKVASGIPENDEWKLWSFARFVFICIIEKMWKTSLQ